MSNNYTSKVTRTAASRGKLKGTTSTAKSTVSSGSVSTGSTTEGHTHANKTALDAISIDAAGYEYLTQYNSEQQTTSTEKVKAGYSDDVSMNAPALTHFIRNDQAARAAGPLTIASNLTVPDGDINTATGQYLGYVTADLGEASIDDAEVTRETVSEKLTLGDNAHIASGTFSTGFTGSGFDLSRTSSGAWALELDKLTVRQVMTIYELIVQKIRAVGGMVVVSPAAGKVKNVLTGSLSYYTLVLEDGSDQFVTGDLVRCQTFTGSALKSYWVRVTSVSGNALTIPRSEFSSVVPEAGDEIVLFGNTSNAARQSAITISASEDGVPRIEVLADISAKTLTNRCRLVLGNLAVTDGRLGSYSKTPTGYGLACDNVYLKGEFYLTNGSSVSTVVANFSDAITLLNSRFNADGTLANTTGLVLEDDFADMFAQAITDQNVVKEARLSLFVEDKDGVTISHARIKADRIEMDAPLTLTQRLIAGQEEGQRIDINPHSGSVDIYNDRGEYCTRLDGRLYKTAAEVLGEGIAGSIDVSEPAGSRSYTGSSQGSGVLQYVTLSPEWTSDNTQTVRLAGKVTLTVTARTKSAQRDCRATVTIGVSDGVGVSSYGTASAVATVSTQAIGTLTEETKTVTVEFDKRLAVSPGTHCVKLMVMGDAPWDGVVISGAEDSNCAIAVQWEGVTCYGYQNDIYRSQYYANGFCLGTRIDNYLMGYQQADGQMALELRRTDGTCLEVTHMGARLSADGGNTWSPIATTSVVQEELNWYGVEWDDTSASPTLTRIGNMALHRMLPLQSRMRGCLLDDEGNVTKYLPDGTWASETRDGTQGQVMVEIPEHYIKYETDGNTRRVKLSEYALSGYTRVQRRYVSAYECTVDRATGVAASVHNETANYRGGDSSDRSSWDGTSLSQLGLPRSGFTYSQAVTVAQRASGWRLWDWDTAKSLYWFMVVEFATFRLTQDYTGGVTEAGYRTGGLGAGVSGWTGSAWTSYNSQCPLCPCGHTDALGNGSGVVTLTAGSQTWSVPRYRGIENPHGHIGKWVEGLTFYGASYGFGVFRVVNGEGVRIGEANTSGGSAYTQTFIFGDTGDPVWAAEGSSSLTYKCAYHWSVGHATDSQYWAALGGSASNPCSPMAMVVQDKWGVQGGIRIIYRPT